MPPAVEAFFHEPSNTVCYVVADPETKRAAIVDSVLDFDMAAGRTSTNHADGVLGYLAIRAGRSSPPQPPPPTITSGGMSGCSSRRA